MSRDDERPSAGDGRLEVLPECDDFAVVQLPKRRHPAVAIQADTLRDLLDTARRAQGATRRDEQDHALDILAHRVEVLAQLDAWRSAAPPGARRPAPPNADHAHSASGRRLPSTLGSRRCDVGHTGGGQRGHCTVGGG